MFGGIGRWYRGLSRKWKILVPVIFILALFVLLAYAFPSAGQNSQFQPQNEFAFPDWVPIHIGSLDVSINKVVLYLFLASALTTGTMIWVARRMSMRPNRVQTAVEWIYTFMRDDLTRSQMDPKTARRWFSFVATIFLFILYSNLIGYIPLPVNSDETWSLFGAQVPAFQIYAATANISVPLILTLIVWFAYHIEGIRVKGLVPYMKGWIPPGTPGGPMKGAIFGIEVLSHFVRIISLSVRLYANILAGHMLILFMAGGMVVLLGLAALGAITVPVAILFYMFESVLIATLQAFIFAILTAIYIGSAVAEEH